METLLNSLNEAVNNNQSLHKSFCFGNTVIMIYKYPYTKINLLVIEKNVGEPIYIRFSGKDLSPFDAYDLVREWTAILNK